MTKQNSSGEGGELIKLQNGSMWFAFSRRKGKLSYFLKNQKRKLYKRTVVKDNLTICVKPAFSGNCI
jgi:hypothetical protein